MFLIMTFYSHRYSALLRKQFCPPAEYNVFSILSWNGWKKFVNEHIFLGPLWWDYGLEVCTQIL